MGLVLDGDKDVVPDDDTVARMDDDSVVEEQDGDTVVLARMDGEQVLCNLFSLLDGGTDAAERQLLLLLPELLLHFPS